MTSRRALLGSVGLNVGALVAAVGVTIVASALAAAGPSGGIAAPVFGRCMLAAAIVVLVLRYSSVRDVVVAVAVRRCLGLAIPVLFLAWLEASGAYTKEEAYVRAMRSQLHELAALEGRALADSGHYTADVGAHFLTSSDYTFAPIRVSASGWSATVSIRQSPRRCAIFVGPTPEPPARQPGMPACTGAPLPQTLRGVAKAIPVLALGLALAIAGASWRRGP